MVYMDAIPKFDIKSVIKSDIKFDISIKPTTYMVLYFREIGTVLVPIAISQLWP